MKKSGYRLCIGLLLILCSIGLSYAANTGYSANDFKAWAKHIKDVIGQVELFVQIVATVVGMWFVYSGLQLFRKHHTAQGAQGEHLRNGSGHLLIGILLMCIVPAIQMLQSTLMSGAGEQTDQTEFTIDKSALN